MSQTDNTTIGPDDFNTRSPLELVCQNSSCDYKWEFTPGEQDWYDLRGFQYPKYCAACKAERKHNFSKRGGQTGGRYQDITICCKDCNHDFQWRAKDQAFFAKQQPPFPPPQRCTSCKQDRNQRFRRD